VRLAWDPNPPDQQITGYRIYSHGRLVATTSATDVLLLLPNVEVYTPVTVTAFNWLQEGPPSDPLYLPPPSVTVERSVDLKTWIPFKEVDFRHSQIIRLKLTAGNPPVATVEQSYTAGVTWVFVGVLPPAPAQFVRLATPPES
jgi:hypothetical protein